MFNDAKSILKKLEIWILVMDSKRAQIYSRRCRGKGMRTMQNQKHSQYQYDENNRELVPVCEPIYAELAEIHGKENDALNKVSEKILSTRYLNEQDIDCTEESHRRFSKKIAAYLNIARAARQFNRLVLIAPAKLLGELRAHLNKTVKMSVIAELSKDLTHCDKKSLATHLEDIA